MNNGAHVDGFNAGNVGVALLGDLTELDPARHDGVRQPHQRRGQDGRHDRRAPRLAGDRMPW